MITTIGVPNFVKLNCILKDLLINEKWFLFPHLRVYMSNLCCWMKNIRITAVFDNHVTGRMCRTLTGEYRCSSLSEATKSVE